MNERFIPIANTMKQVARGVYIDDPEISGGQETLIQLVQGMRDKSRRKRERLDSALGLLHKISPGFINTSIASLLEYDLDWIPVREKLVRRIGYGYYRDVFLMTSNTRSYVMKVYQRAHGTTEELIINASRDLDEQREIAKAFASRGSSVLTPVESIYIAQDHRGIKQVLAFQEYMGNDMIDYFCLSDYERRKLLFRYPKLVNELYDVYDVYKQFAERGDRLDLCNPYNLSVVFNNGDAHIGMIDLHFQTATDNRTQKYLQLLVPQYISIFDSNE